MSPAAPLALLERRTHEEPLLTTVPTVHDSAGDPVVAYLARLTSAKSRSTMSGALALVAVELGAADAHAIRWGALRYPHVAALRGRLAERLAPATTNKILCAVRGVAREAMRLGLLSAEAFTRIADIEGIRGERLPAGRHVEGPDLVSLFGACSPTTPGGVRDHALLGVLRVTGLRRAEIGALDLADLDRHTWVLRVLGKGNKERRGYVAAVRPELEAWLVVRGEAPGPLFCAVKKGGFPKLDAPLGESGIAWIVDRLVKRAAIEHVSPHDMRRTYIGDLLDAGADLAIVQRLAGHAQVSTTQRYDQRPERAAARLSIPRLV